MKKLSQLLLVALAGLSLSLAAAAPVAAVDVVAPNCEGEAANSAVCRDNQSTASENPIFGPSGILTRVIHILSILVGIAAVVVIMISGLRMTVSQGDPNTVATARRSLLYAVFGIVIAALAQAIVIFVLRKI